LKYKTFSEFHRLLFAFLFFSIFNVFFSVLPPYNCQKILKTFVFFIVWIEDFIKEFCKTMVFFSRKFDIFEIRNFTKILYFTFSFLFF